MMKKIRILHILDSLCVGGMENCVVGLCNNLDKSKFDIFLLVLSNNNNQLTERLDPKVHLIVLPMKYRFVMNTFLMFFLIPIIGWTILKIRPQIIHTHCYQLRLLAEQLSTLMTFKSYHFFHTIHTAGLHYSDYRIISILKRKIESLFYNICKTNIVCVSDIVYSKCIQLFPKRKVYCINNGVETDLSSISINKTIVSAGIMNFVYVSRLHQGKNHAVLLDAFQLLCRKNKKVRLYLVGDGDLRDDIQKMIVSLGIEDKVFLLGNRNDVSSILKSCQIGVFPSLFEGLSLALLEMMAAGLPIICSDIPEFRNIFKKSNDALFFDKEQAKDLMEKMSVLLEDEELRNALSEKSLSIVKEYSLKNMAEEYSVCYLNRI